MILQKSPSRPTKCFFGTYVSVLAASSHHTVDVADAALRSNNQRSASVHNSLAAATASHDLSVDSNTERDRAKTDIKHFCLYYQFVDVWIHLVGTVALPVHCDLPVQLIREGNPGDGAIVVVGVSTTKGHHTSLLRVTAEESKNLLMNLLKITISALVKVYIVKVRMLYNDLTFRHIFLSLHRILQNYGHPYEVRYTEKRSWLTRPSFIMLSKTGVAPEADRRG